MLLRISSFDIYANARREKALAGTFSEYYPFHSRHGHTSLGCLIPTHEILTVVVLPLGGVEPLGPAAVLAVVVDEHVVGHGEQLTLHTRHRRHHNLLPYFQTSAHIQTLRNMSSKNIVSTYLKSPHVAWVASILQAILIAFQEKLQEEPTE